MTRVGLTGTNNQGSFDNNTKLCVLHKIAFVIPTRSTVQYEQPVHVGSRHYVIGIARTSRE